MKAKSILLVVAILGSASSLFVTGCVSKNSSGGGGQPGYYSGSNNYSAMPMNQAARTDAMRQQYRNEFR